MHRWRQRLSVTLAIGVARTLVYGPDALALRLDRVTTTHAAELTEDLLQELDQQRATRTQAFG